MAIGADRGILVALPLASCACQLEVAGKHVQALKDNKVIVAINKSRSTDFRHD